MEKPALPGSGASSSARRHTVISWALLVAGIALSATVALGVRQQYEQEARHKFEEAARDVLYRVKTEIGAYEEVLIGLSAFMGSKEFVSRAEFHRYVDRLDLDRRFPGFDNLNYAHRVPLEGIPALQQAVRRDNSVHPTGYPAFTVTPEHGPRDSHVIVYFEPWEKSGPSFGRNLAALPGMSAGLIRLAESGRIITSGRLIRIDGADKRVGLAMRVAVYRAGAILDSQAARLQAFAGSVGAGYRIADIVRSAVSDQQREGLHFRLIDQGIGGQAPGPEADRLLFDSAELEGAAGSVAFAGGFEYAGTFPVGGRIWQMTFHGPREAAGPLGAAAPWLVLLGGLITTLLLFGLFRSFANSRRNAEALAHAITRDLRESEVSLAEAQRIAKVGNWSIDLRDGRMHWSAEALRLLGLDMENASATLETYFSRVHPEDRAAVQAAIDACLHGKSSMDIEHRLRCGEGYCWVRALGEARRNAAGGTEILRCTLMDISEHKLEARRKELEMGVAQCFASGRATVETMNSVVELMRRECGLASGRYIHPDQDDAQPSTNAQVVRLPLVAEERNLGAIEFVAGVEMPDEQRVKLIRGVAQHIGQYLLRRQAEDNFKYLATHDALTGLPNRLLFGERVSAAIGRAERAKHGLGVLFVDLDRFKNINDTLGHGAGDAVLKACAERLSRTLRDSDVVARISGDEFAVLVEPCLQPSAAIAVARKVLSAIERPLHVHGQEIVLTGSVGMSIFHEDGRDAETLLKHADIAMFRAKEHGGNSYQFYSSQMNPHSLERLGLETALRRALERDEFLLHYQPKLDLRNGQITGVEALVRWKHAEMGMISPAQFIPIAEETGLIEPIGAWVLREACAQAARWHAEGLGTRIAVNLSARQVSSGRLVREVRKCLSEHSLDPRLLELELTESMVMQNPEAVAQTLRELKAMGVALSIDDFGTGYSSLAYLKRFPIDSVKIDRSFVREIPGNAEDGAIVEAVIALAHSMRLRVVAEGVETTEQLEHLRSLTCDEMQGYFFSKPLPSDEATNFLRADQSKTADHGKKRSLTAVR